MRGALIVAGLTWKEAVRRKTLVGSFLLGLLVLASSLILVLISIRMHQNVASGKIDEENLPEQLATARGVITLISLFFIRVLGSLFAIMLAGGAISSEIERGVLTVILTKPIRRWQILFGKWLGLQIVLVGSTIIWTLVVWISLRVQTHQPLWELLRIAPLMGLYPFVICTVSLSLSTVSQRLLGTSLALTVTALSWSDGILNFLGMQYDVSSLHRIADFVGLLLPQGYIAWWVYDAIGDTILRNPMADKVVSSRLLQEYGAKHLHFAHLDVAYLVGYTAIVFAIGAWLLQRRDAV